MCEFSIPSEPVKLSTIYYKEKEYFIVDIEGDSLKCVPLKGLGKEVIINKNEDFIITAAPLQIKTTDK